MAFTQNQLDALDEAIASGALKVKYADREIQYQTMDDLLRARNLVAGKLAEAAGTSVSGRRTASFCKGL